MRGIVSYFVVVVATVVCMAGLGAAVMCYDCTSTDSGPCSFPFNATGIAVKNCTSNPCITFRAGILNGASFSGAYTRGCNTFGYSNGCTGVGSLVVCSMVCSTDNCNNMNHGNAGPTPVGAYIFSALLVFTIGTIKALAY